MFHVFFNNAPGSGAGERAPFLKRRQSLMIGAGGLFIFGVAYILLEGNDTGAADIAPAQKKVATSFNTVSTEERWVNRVEKKSEETKKELEHLKAQNSINEQRMVAMEKIVTGRLGDASSENSDLWHQQGVGEKKAPTIETKMVGKKMMGASLQEDDSPNTGMRTPYTPGRQGGERLEQDGDTAAFPKIFQSSLTHIVAKVSKNVDTYIPAGTHAKGILLSGLTAYTGVNSSADPEPIKIRLLDYGVIAKGFKGDIKDAVILGSCYGEISAERARCRMHTLTLEENNGEIIEVPVEGWVMGEDGRSGVRGEVIDRAGELARSALISGILGGMGRFFQQQASSTGPMSLLGQTSGLKGRELMEGAGASGASNALEKLSEYTIKRAEKMEPVIVVDAGRQIDVLFKKGFDLSGTSLREELHRVGQNTRETKAREQIRQQGIQSGEGQ